jgi:hypothetical protein
VKAHPIQEYLYIREKSNQTPHPIPEDLYIREKSNQKGENQSGLHYYKWQRNLTVVRVKLLGCGDKKSPRARTAVRVVRKEAARGWIEGRGDKKSPRAGRVARKEAARQGGLLVRRWIEGIIYALSQPRHNAGEAVHWWPPRLGWVASSAGMGGLRHWDGWPPP